MRLRIIFSTRADARARIKKAIDLSKIVILSILNHWDWPVIGWHGLGRAGLGWAGSGWRVLARMTAQDRAGAGWVGRGLRWS